eukprot:Amastigsp_a508867_92.p3 type:complete len:177 gc:universal Amastigsp_a508867_92:1225-695(-)
MRRRLRPSRTRWSLLLGTVAIRLSLASPLSFLSRPEASKQLRRRQCARGRVQSPDERNRDGGKSFIKRCELLCNLLPVSRAHCGRANVVDEDKDVACCTKDLVTDRNSARVRKLHRGQNLAHGAKDGTNTLHTVHDGLDDAKLRIVERCRMRIVKDNDMLELLAGEPRRGEHGGDS